MSTGSGVSIVKSDSLHSAHQLEHVVDRVDERIRSRCAPLDREDIERRLCLWHARDLVPGHYVALHHIAWSRFPMRSGWADFQRELRAVATVDTPDSPTDAAALLLALAVNYAAPGSHELLELAMR